MGTYQRRVVVPTSSIFHHANPMTMTPYRAYLKMQIAGPVHKPEHYHVAERKTIDYLFRDIPKGSYVLDVGCAIGLGVKYLRGKGFVADGIDLDKRKTAEFDEPGYRLINADFTLLDFSKFVPWDVIYCSHCLEHVWDADVVIEKMKEITKPKAKFFFILPYPDLNPSPAHWSTPAIGLDISDGAVTVENWFGERGLVVTELTFDDYRESEIWLTLEKE